MKTVGKQSEYEGVNNKHLYDLIDKNDVIHAIFLDLLELLGFSDVSIHKLHTLERDFVNLLNKWSKE